MRADNNLSTVQQIRANAELVVSVMGRELGQVLNYDEAGVRWLDGYIQRQHKHGDPENREALVSTLGSFLGECVISSFGGQWIEKDGEWGVEFSLGNVAYPFNKVAKHLENGSEDSVLSFFTVIPLVFKRG